MNPWNEAEASDESLERELFARRARALDAADVPPLSAVMRAAEARRVEVAPVKGGRGHAVVALALAAACAMAAITRLPHGERVPSGDRIVAEIDAGPAPSSMTAAATNEVPPSGTTCSLDDERLAADDRGQCVPPAPQYTPVPEPCAASHAAAVAPCDPNESCALGAQ